MTDWSDAELNPFGLIHMDQGDQQPRRVSVVLEVKALAYFKSRAGHTYVCGFVNDKRKREVFVQTERGFLEVTDPGIKFTVAKWTDEIIAARRS